MKALQFRDDGSRLLVGVRPGLVTEWPVEPADLLAQIRARGLARELTDDERRELDEVLGR